MSKIHNVTNGLKLFFVVILIASIPHIELWIILLPLFNIIMIVSGFYRIETDDDSITFYRIIKRKKHFSWESIKRISIEDVCLGYNATFTRLTIYDDLDQYDLSVTLFNKASLYKDLINRAAANDIIINDMTSKHKKINLFSLLGKAEREKK